MNRVKENEKNRHIGGEKAFYLVDLMRRVQLSLSEDFIAVQLLFSSITHHCTENPHSMLHADTNVIFKKCTSQKACNLIFTYSKP